MIFFFLFPNSLNMKALCKAGPVKELLDMCMKQSTNPVLASQERGQYRVLISC